MINGVGNASGRVEGIKEEIEIGEERGIAKGREVGMELGQAQGRQEGLEPGREEVLMTVIYTAFEQRLSTEVIASLTHMSIEEIEKLRETSNV